MFAFVVMPTLDFLKAFKKHEVNPVTCVDGDKTGFKKVDLSFPSNHVYLAVDTESRSLFSHVVQL